MIIFFISYSHSKSYPLFRNTQSDNPRQKKVYL